MVEITHSYIVIPAGDVVGDYPGARSQVVGHTPEGAVLLMAQKDFREFKSAEASYDVYTHSKKPVLVQAGVPCPPEEDLVDKVLPAESMEKKGCGCGAGSCSHNDKEAQLVVLLLAEGVGDPAALAKKILEVLK